MTRPSGARCGDAGVRGGGSARRGAAGAGRLAGWLLAALLVWAAGARAAESAAVASARVTATLVSDTDAPVPGRAFRLGLRLRMAPGWHTYWSNPGDAGVAPVLSLVLPSGVQASPIAWPAPELLLEGSLAAYAYTGDLLLPVTVSGAPGGMTVRAHADWLVCSTVCVPESGDFALDLAPPAGLQGAGLHGAGLPGAGLPGDAAPSAQAGLFAAADARTPVASPFGARLAGDGTLSVSGREITRASVRDAYFFPAEPGVLVHSAPQPLSVRADGLTLRLPLAAGAHPGQGIDGVLRLTDARGGVSWLAVAAAPGGTAQDAAQDAAGTPAAGAVAAGPGDAAGSAGAVLRTLLLALAGGLVLNLMPCVFPVLAMKAMALARLSGASRAAVRRQAAGYTAGVLVAFAALGAVMLVLRGAGAAAGWGFQFQSPVFVIATAWVLFAVGLMLSGVVTPVSGLEGAGQGLAAREGVAGSVFTGLLAVLVATPCTAPFMGVALAAAFASPPVPAMAVFLAMGLGLAAPTLLLAAVPGLARGLPRPGAWMEVLRQALAFPMYAAAVWLAWVAAVEAGPAGVLACLAGGVALGFAAWAWGVSRPARPAGRRFGGAAALAGAGVAAAVLAGAARLPAADDVAAQAAGTAGLGGAGQAGSGQVGAAQVGAAQVGAGQVGAGVARDGSEPFSAARLESLRAQGRPVFVDMTAAWCFTCLVNERVALSPQPVRDAFARRDVAYLKGDWTRQDPEITAFLRAHGRDGVPLYVYYPPGGTAAVLPQILTPSGVLAALRQG